MEVVATHYGGSNAKVVALLKWVRRKTSTRVLDSSRDLAHFYGTLSSDSVLTIRGNFTLEPHSTSRTYY